MNSFIIYFHHQNVLPKTIHTNTSIFLFGNNFNRPLIIQVVRFCVCHVINIIFIFILQLNCFSYDR